VRLFDDKLEAGLSFGFLLTEAGNQGKKKRKSKGQKFEFGHHQFFS
jgi:hypothetical protein